MLERWSVELTDDEWAEVYKALIISERALTRNIANKVYSTRKTIRSETNPFMHHKRNDRCTEQECGILDAPRYCDVIHDGDCLTPMAPRAKADKPPLGLMPARLFYEERAKRLSEAINRYLQSGNAIVPGEWVEEYNSIIKYLKKE